MIGRNTIIFSVITLILIVSVVILVRQKDSGQPKTLRQTVGCAPDTIADSVLDLDSRTTLIGAFISFDAAPSQETLDNISDLEVSIDQSSWIFDDSVLAQIPTRSLCELAEIESVRLIFIPQDN